MTPQVEKMVRKKLAPGARIRVLVVDDSDMTRRVLSDALARDPDIDVVGGARNGIVALERIPQVSPDVITLDVQMPEMDGLETLSHIRRLYPEIHVVMVSALTSQGASVTLEALARGASDYLAKPSSHISPDSIAMRTQLAIKIKQFFPLPGDATEQVQAASVERTGRERPKAIVMAASTGGPSALADILPHVPASFPLPILIVQHLPPVFTTHLAERLAVKAKLRVEEAWHGAIIERGKILIAPGDYHMRIKDAGEDRYLVQLDQGPQENSSRPAADVLFRSAAETWGGGVIGVVLTGMGKDGLAGARALHDKGAYVIAQDEASSLVWGMAGSAVRAGITDAVVPADGIARKLMELV
jgi:two-component system chemotaxis response regulator CheB